MIKMPRGTQDILPQDSAKWRYIENRLHTLMELYNYKEIRTPILKVLNFCKRRGDSTDVVQKEMYTFKDKGDRSLTLRPEGTAAVVRSYIEHKMQVNPINLSNFTTMVLCLDTNVNKRKISPI